MHEQENEESEYAQDSSDEEVGWALRGHGGLGLGPCSGLEEPFGVWMCDC